MTITTKTVYLYQIMNSFQFLEFTPSRESVLEAPKFNVLILTYDLVVEMASKYNTECDMLASGAQYQITNQVSFFM